MQPQIADVVRRRGERLQNRVDHATDLARYFHLLHTLFVPFRLLSDLGPMCRRSSPAPITPRKAGASQSLELLSQPNAPHGPPSLPPVGSAPEPSTPGTSGGDGRQGAGEALRLRPAISRPRSSAEATRCLYHVVPPIQPLRESKAHVVTPHCHTGSPTLPSLLWVYFSRC